ncbi:unnamed protein product, partial [marine sediment metagenome]
MFLCWFGTCVSEADSAPLGPEAAAGNALLAEPNVVNEVCGLIYHGKFDAAAELLRLEGISGQDPQSRLGRLDQII